MSPRLDRRNPPAATAIRSALTARLGARFLFHVKQVWQINE
jgi:hypothetical protein